MNMSYCRWRNTNNDLLDCLDSITDEEERKLSKEELSACIDMFERFLDFCETEGIFEDDEYQEKLDEFFEGFKVEWNEDFILSEKIKIY